MPGNKNSNTLVIRNGNIGVGVTNPTVPLANGAKCPIGGVWTNASSRTLKDGISDLGFRKLLNAIRRLLIHLT